jgi:DNA-directed RNA polymerase subunit F
MYNIINGVNQAALFILPMLDKHPDKYLRFRDCFLFDEDHPEYDNYIHVYTRSGGGNREEFEEEIEEIRKHPNYITDYDDNFDCTYASFIFSVPDEYKNDYEKIINNKITEISEKYKKKIVEIYPKLEDDLKELFDKK